MGEVLKTLSANEGEEHCCNSICLGRCLKHDTETYWNEMNGTFLLWSSYVYGQFLDHFLCLVCFFVFPVLLQFHSSTSFTSPNHRLLQDPGVSHVQTVFNRSHYQHIHSIAKDRGLWDYFLMVFDMMWHFRLLKNLSRMNPICETWECVDLQVD